MAELSMMPGSSDEIRQRNPLLATKLYIPPTRPKFVFRPHLTLRLSEGIQGKLTLLCAPAGFGKTSLLSEWYARHATQATDVDASAWVSLDSSDNDPVRFWSYVLAALERAYPGIGDTLFGLLQSPEPPAMQLILTMLINALLTYPGRILLILDDYHVITTPSIHEGLTFLLDHLPPQLHVILASRSDPPLPLSRLRSSGQLSELRADELCFTLDETVAFLKMAIDQHFPEETALLLEQSTEGWIAGLQLIALSLKGRANNIAFINTFTGSHRYILDYLSQEVLHQQPEAIQRFLLQTSILERLSGPLCDAVTGQRNSQEVLEQLEQANLFIVPLDDERGWYRYHHLFNDVLRRHLQQTSPEQIPTLHCRASAWYEQRGFIPEAVGHALAVASYEQAAQLMEQVANRMLLHGERSTLRQWIQSLPAEYLPHHPRLCITYAVLQAYNLQLDAAEPYLQMAEAHLQNLPGRETTSEAEEMLGEIDGIRAELAARLQGDYIRAIALSHQALARIPRENVFQRANINLNLGFAYIYTGGPAQQALMEAAKLSQATGNLHGVLYAYHYQARLHINQGKLHEAYSDCQRALQLVKDHPAQKRSEHIYITLGDILREWNMLDAATQALKKGIECCEQIGDMGLMGIGCIYLARVKQALGAQDEALLLMQQSEQITQNRKFTGVRNNLLPYYARLWLAQGTLDLAARWAQEHRQQDTSLLTHQLALDSLTVVRVLLALSRSGKALPDRDVLAEALRLVQQIQQAALADGRHSYAIEAFLLQALVLQEQGKLQEAQKVLQQALTRAEPEGYIRLFVDEGAPMAALLQQVGEKGIASAYTSTLLKALGIEENAQQGGKMSSPPPRPLANSSEEADLLEPLSERELEVLHLIAEGRSNEEIARALCVSIGTVKTHLRHIYDKLDVHTRTQATARGRKFHLLPS
jgi:LuxR family transcriptional regulator, maltose regulon positive regulatory protein